MNERDGYSGAQIVLAFLAGALTGSCLALLTAPQPGNRTRGAIRDWTRDTGGKASRLPEALRQAYREASRAAGKAFNEALAESSKDRE